MEQGIPDNNETLVRELYRLAELQDLVSWAEFFADDGYFWDVAMGRRYRGEEISEGLALYSTAFPNMHRELYEFHVCGEENAVIVELSMNGTHLGPLTLPSGTLAPTGRNIHVPCCDVILLEGGKVRSYHCYVSNGTLLRQLGL